MSVPIYIGADHAGFELKEQLKKFFRTKKISFVDVGNVKLDPKDDYPDYGIMVAEKVARTKSKGILVCGSSYGVCIVANKKRGIRAVSLDSVRDARLSRQHNDANVLCLSGWNTPLAQAKRVAMIFLNTPASKAPRHLRRVKKITAYEQKNLK